VYTVYTTNAFVISLDPQGETDCAFTLYTKDFGRIVAVAKGIRKIESKLKSHLPQYGYVSVSMVRGREVWRITSAQILYSLYEKRITLTKRQNIARALHTVSRLCPGELPQDNIFTLCEAFFRHTLTSQIKLEKQKEVSEHLTLLTKHSAQQRESIEFDIFCIKLLSLLGYQSDLNILRVIIEEKNFEYAIGAVELHESIKSTLSSEVARIISETHL
jgi:hypothetical protein